MFSIWFWEWGEHRNSTLMPTNIKPRKDQESAIPVKTKSIHSGQLAILVNISDNNVSIWPKSGVGHVGIDAAWNMKKVPLYTVLYEISFLRHFLTQDEVKTLHTDVLLGLCAVPCGGLAHWGGGDWSGEVGRPLVSHEKLAAVEPECCGVEDWCPGAAVMLTCLIHCFCCVERASWEKRRANYLTTSHNNAEVQYLMTWKL